VPWEEIPYDDGHLKTDPLEASQDIPRLVLDRLIAYNKRRVRSDAKRKHLIMHYGVMADINTVLYVANTVYTDDQGHLSQFPPRSRKDAARKKINLITGGWLVLNPEDFDYTRQMTIGIMVVTNRKKTDTEFHLHIWHRNQKITAGPGAQSLEIKTHNILEARRSAEALLVAISRQDWQLPVRTHLYPATHRTQECQVPTVCDRGSLVRQAVEAIVAGHPVPHE